MQTKHLFPCVAVLAVWLASAASAQDHQGVRWYEDLNQAKQVAAQTNRLVLVHFTATWCRYCKPLEANVFPQRRVAQAIEGHYVPVKLDIDKNRGVAQQYGIRYLPWDLVITPQGQMVKNLKSPRTAEQYMATMTDIAVEHRQLQQVQLAGQTQQTGATGSNGPVQPAGANLPYNVAQAQTGGRYGEFQAQPAAGGTLPPSDCCDVRHNPSENLPYRGNGVVAQGEAGLPVRQVAANLPVAQPTPGTPPLAMDGFCPVHLAEQGEWVAGVPNDPRFGVIHRGRLYLFASTACQQKFMARPDYYSPVLGGNDPVQLVEHGQAVAGKREHGCFFGVDGNRRIVLFSSEASYQAFERNPARYTAHFDR